MLRGILLAVLCAAGTPAPAAVQINGAGATFSAPLYERWFQDYNRLHPEVQVNYQPIGSAAGIKQFTHGTIDFGASDAAMTDEQIARVAKGAILLPMTAGEIVLPYNLPGIPQLRLSRSAYIGIFLGSIQKWNDAAIRSSNPGVSLPDLPITVVYRYDGSGTTFVFTKHLCAISPHFKERVIEEGTQVTWPVGIGGKGNEGVTAIIKDTQGAIGYVEYNYALENKLAIASLQNRSGIFVKPSLESGALALSRIDLPPDLRGWAADPTGPDDYPITTFTWLLLYKSYADPAKVAALKAVMRYGLAEGQKCAPEMGYIPLPASVAEKVRAAVEAIR